MAQPRPRVASARRSHRRDRRAATRTRARPEAGGRHRDARAALAGGQPAGGSRGRAAAVGRPRARVGGRACGPRARATPGRARRRCTRQLRARGCAGARLARGALQSVCVAAEGVRLGSPRCALADDRAGDLHRPTRYSARLVGRAARRHGRDAACRRPRERHREAAAARSRTAGVAREPRAFARRLSLRGLPRARHCLSHGRALRAARPQRGRSGAAFVWARRWLVDACPARRRGRPVRRPAVTRRRRGRGSHRGPGPRHPRRPQRQHRQRSDGHRGAAPRTRAGELAGISRHARRSCLRLPDRRRLRAAAQ